MNERIKELLIQSEVFNKDGTVLKDVTGYELNKFAELIVKECADICMEMAAKCAGLPGDGALAKDCADWIKKDFGVEE
jgi:predicted nucleotidyltransferase